MGRGGGEAENGVAPVIATLLILALTIFMVAIFAAVILNIGNTDAAPIAGVIISDNNGVISLTHYSGAALHVGEYKILVNGVDQTNKFQPVGRDFSPGTKLTWDLGITQPLSDVSVIYTGDGKSVVIAEKKFNREGTAKANANFSASVPAGKGKDATSQVKTDVSGARALPAIVADRADVWVVRNQTSGQVTVEFTAEESSDMTYSWTFSNGQTNSTRMASFVSTTAGSYTVRLDIVDNISGDVGTSSKIVAVRNPGVTALAWIKRDSDISSEIKAPIVARTAAIVGVAMDNKGGWEIRYDPGGSHGIHFKSKFSENPGKQIQVKSRILMVLGTWYHAAGVVDQSGTTIQERQRIYVNGVYPPLTQNEPTITPPEKIYMEPASSSIKRNTPFFSVSSYSEVPFPLSGPEITSIYDVEKLYPR